MNFWRHPRTWLVVGLLAAAGLAALAPWLEAHQLITSYHILVVETAGVSVILGVSLNLILGHTGQFSLGHAGFMAVGAFAAAITTNLLVPVIGHSFWLKQLWLAPALLAGGLAAAIAGLAVGIPSLRLKGDYLAIVTLGFGEIVAVLLQNAQNAVSTHDAWSKRLPWVGASAVEVPERPMLFWTLAGCVLVFYVCQSLIKSTYGSGFLAVRDDEVAAQACGISAARAKVTAFVIGAFFAGMAGGLYAHFIGSIIPSGFRFDRSIEVVLIVILGGVGRNFAVVLAAIAVTLLSEGLRKAPDVFPSADGRVLELLQNRAFFFALILVILMILRPQGLFSGWKKPKFLGGAK